MGAWEKFQLGWLNYEVAYAGKKSEHKLGPMEANTKQAQGLFVVLPKKPVTTNIGAPYAGTYYYYSGAGDNLNSFMYQVVQPGAGATLTAKVKYNIELDWDYAYLIVSTDGGATWQTVPTNLSTLDRTARTRNGITGVSSGWVDLTAEPAGRQRAARLPLLDRRRRHRRLGFMVDDINITGFPTDGAETDAGWTYSPRGFHVTTGTEDEAVQPLLRGRAPQVLGLRQHASRSARTSSAT